ncbi:MAG: hypothetical protein V4559_08935 [Pseudomonadota bacterium]
MRRLVAAISALLVISGCTGLYDPPHRPVPDLWDGKRQVGNVAGTHRVYPGTRHVGDVVQDLQWGPERTGTIAERVELKTLFGHTIIIPKGAKAWATNLGFESSTSFISDVDPVEWCVLLPEGADGKGGGSQTVCAFYESPDRALYILDTRHGGYLFNPDLGSPWGTPGPVPRIEEGPVDFGFTVHNETRIREISPTQIRVEALLNNGTNSIVVGKYVWQLDGKRQKSFSGSPRGYVITAFPDSQSVEIRMNGT